jgi:nitrite reductase/ring-hydroxylating ferredoxin subunit
VELCRLEDLVDGEARGYAVPGLRRKVIVIRKGGVVYSYLDACPHYSSGTPMAWKTNAYLDGEGRHLACHSHNALFDIETGACILGPCLGQSLTRVPVHITDHGVVDATIDAFREELA